MGDPRVRRALGVARRLSPSVFSSIVKATSGISALRFPLRERGALLHVLRLNGENRRPIIITARPRRTLPEIKRVKTRRGLHLDNRSPEAASDTEGNYFSAIQSQCITIANSALHFKYNENGG